MPQSSVRAAISRRQFYQLTAASAATLTMTSELTAKTLAGRGRAQACILLWLGGGMCHVDTLDPKTLGDPTTNKAGSAYPSIPTAIQDARVCQHLERTAQLLDRGVLLRTLNHPLKVDHADSTNLVKTGRRTSGTVVYPSLGSVISHERGIRTRNVPPYVVIGYPNVTRGPGFLGGRYGYLHLTDIDAGPNGLRPHDVQSGRQQRRLKLLKRARTKALAQSPGDATVEEYDAAITEAEALMKGPLARLWGGERVADIKTLRRYGGEFGQRCLLARRLVETGVRFVEVAYDLNFKNGTGWDTHRHGQKNQHLLIRDLDESLSALLEDLEQRRLLDETLVVVATEFGRPPDFDGQGGRGPSIRSLQRAAIFGGGLKNGQVIGATDDLGRKVAERPISIPDFHATILTAMGVDPSKELYDGDRPIPITDHGRAVNELFG